MRRVTLIAVLWICRLLPVWTWAACLIGAVALPEDAFQQSFALGALLVVTLCSYILLVYVLIPELLAHGKKRSFKRYAYDFLLAGFTAGLYMVISYWTEVDPALRQKLHSNQCIRRKSAKEHAQQ